MSSSKKGEKKPCTHPRTWEGMCTLCGEPVFNEDDRVPDSHGFKLAVSQARDLREEIDRKLIASRKLKLILDMDETLIHTRPLRNGPSTAAAAAGEKGSSATGGDGENRTRDSKSADGELVQLPPSKEIQLADKTWHIVSVRPHLAEFLASVGKVYELKLYSHGAGFYVNSVLSLIDPDGRYFNHGQNVISKDENPSDFKDFLYVPAEYDDSSKLYARPFLRKEIVPSVGSPATVVIVDDRKDVWSKDSRNVLQIFPCLFILCCCLLLIQFTFFFFVLLQFALSNPTHLVLKRITCYG